MDTCSAVVINEDSEKVTVEGCPREDSPYCSNEPLPYALPSVERTEDTTLPVEPTSDVVNWEPGRSAKGPDCEA